MKYLRTLTLAAGTLGLSGAACSGDASAPKTTLSAVVAPLDLPAATDACYHLTVWNDVSELDEDTQVWDQPVLCASQYGANNGIRFTGICDAQAGSGDADPDNDGKNAIRLILNDIYKDGDVDTGTALTAGEDYINPCPAPTGGEDNGCVLIADCEQNQDTKIEFNLTVMRQAELGFFDTVVKISDVFCAAKLDCEDQNDEALTYLHNPDTNADGETAVLGFTCLGGSGDAINMYLGDLVITCRDEDGDPTRTATVDPSQGPGNVTPTFGGDGDDFLFGAAVNTGEGFQGSRYWNVLLGINGSEAGETCTLEVVGTVREGALSGTPYATPEHTRYPFIKWDVVLSEDGARACSKHPLNGGSGVSTEYSEIDEPQTFAHQLDLSAPVIEVQCPCWDSTTGAAAIATIAAQGDYIRNYNLGTLLSFSSASLNSTESFTIEGDQCKYSGNADWLPMSPEEALKCAAEMGSIYTASPAP